jgi:cation diffusion facilitator CzcD-associated flavoprotein CzcO
MHVTISESRRDSNLARDGTAHKLCVLGAGSSGLAACKSLRERGIAFDCLEREADIGGNWNFGRPHSSVYQSTRMISSKSLTEYPDFPMPSEYPDYPDHEQVMRYLRGYAEHFQLYSHIEFGTGIRQFEPAVDEGWDVALDSGERRRYRGLVIANGHNWDPRWPLYPGRFD